MKAKKVILAAFVAGLILSQFVGEPRQSIAAPGPNCRNCHDNVADVHHLLVQTQGVDCLHCHWDEATQTIVMKTECFDCHVGAHHFHGR